MRHRQIKNNTCFNTVLQFLALGWKGVYAVFIPPAHYFSGIITFIMSFLVMGTLIYLLSEFSRLLGCVLHIEASIIATVVISLGTAMPNMMITYERIAGYYDEDDCQDILLETYRTCVVNLLLGFGVPWVIAAHYNQYNYGWKTAEFIGYFIPSHTLGFNLIVLICCMILTLIFFGIRRATNGGIMMGKDECGGIIAFLFLVLIWITYVTLSGAWATDYISAGNWTGGIDMNNLNVIRGCNPKENMMKINIKS